MGRGVQREVPGTHTLWLIARCCPIQPPWRFIIQSTKMLPVQSLCCCVSISTIYATKTCLRKIAFGSLRSIRFARLCLRCPCFIHAPRNVGNVETTGHKWTNGKRSAERSRRVSVYLMCWLVLSLTQAGVTCEERNTLEDMAPHDWSVEHVFEWWLMWEGSAGCVSVLGRCQSWAGAC